MQIELKSIPIRDLIDGYLNDPDAGVVGYGGSTSAPPISANSATTSNSSRQSSTPS